MQHYIGKYIRGSGLDDALVVTQVFGKKVIEQVLSGTHYIRSLRAILILVDSINRLKWDAFWENNKKEKYKETLPLLETFYYEVTKTHLNHISIILRHTKSSLQNWKTILLVFLM